MGRKLVTIRQITDLRPVANTPAFEIAVVDGWTCAVRTGVFTKGELVVFFEIDSFLPAPADDPRYQPQHNPLHTGVITWQGAKGIHVRSIMVNKSHEISQGVVLKLYAFPEIESIYLDYSTVLGPETGLQNMADICFAEKLGVKKWQVATAEATTSLGRPPVFFPKTEIERVQNIKTLFTKSKYASAVFQESVKMDGSAMTVYYVRKESQFYKSLPRLPPGARADMANGRVGVSSRNHDLSECAAGGQSSSSQFWAMALHYRLPRQLERLGRNVAVQGELVGSSVASNRHGYAAGRHDFYVYGIFDVDAQRYLHPAEAAVRAAQLGLRHVPVLGYVRIRDVAGSCEELLRRAEGVGMNGRRREGLVYKNVEDGRWFKVGANDYLLTHGE
ncbi:RNA ligase, DRB0094 family [Hypoxylon rubiginosum]|uniref:RNA ligase, DRB0094 family n=1 Tax=Hypoxylon rubiginosum TaxID=110542 RepID=A0ACB9YYF8_9PEZI|nr:RNA ligase, DRB0094 family [Hypoxylon rubiginosum]